MKKLHLPGFKFWLVLLIVIAITLIVYLYAGSLNSGIRNEFTKDSPSNDLAKNDGSFMYPNPMESDPGWGEAVFPWHLVDGIRYRGDFWSYGLAFTGGKECIEDSCGWRQATIDFGEPVRFNRIIIWHAGDNTNIPFYYLCCWNKQTQNWDTILRKTDLKSRAKAFIEKNERSIPAEDTFSDVLSDKIRYLFNNCSGDHGWLNEFEVYYDKPGERPDCLEIR